MELKIALRFLFGFAASMVEKIVIQHCVEIL